MRKWIGLLTGVMLCMVCGIQAQADGGGVFSGGDGTAQSPWIIETESQLAEMANYKAGKYFQLANDIALTGGWTPVGSQTEPFESTLLGGRCCISMLNVAQDEEAGLFGVIGPQGEVKDLVIQANNVSGSTAGALAGENRGTIYRCGVNEGGQVAALNGAGLAGGLVGKQTGGSIVQSFSKTLVNAGTAGGLIGCLESGKAENVYALSNVSGTREAGGIAGLVSGGTVESVYAMAAVSGAVKGELFGKITSATAVIPQYTESFYQSDKGAPIGEGGSQADLACCKGISGNYIYSQESYFMEFFSTQPTVWSIYEEKSTPRFLWELFPRGEGTQVAPFMIMTAEHLDNLHYTVGSLYDNLHYELGQDIDLSGFNWTPIAGKNKFVYPDEHFAGTLNGNNHRILNLVIAGNKGNYYTGLFGYIHSSGSISNLHIVIGEEGINQIDSISIGGLAGTCDGNLTNCTVTGGSVTGNGIVGGLVGCKYAGVASLCYTDTVVRGNSKVGGLVGYLHKTNSRPQPEINECGSMSRVEGIPEDERNQESGMIGGLVGYIQSGTVFRCYSGGEVSGTDSVGGLAGSSAVYSRCRIEDSYAFGNVSGKDSIGGLAGLNMAVVHSSYSAGKVNGETDSGRFIGNDWGMPSDVKDNVAVYWHDSPKYTPYKTGVTEVEGESIRNKATYPNFDFDTVWAIDEATSLPYLQWQKGQKHPDGTEKSNNYDVTGLGYTYGGTTGLVDATNKVVVSGDAAPFALTGTAPDAGGIIIGKAIDLPEWDKDYTQYLIGISESGLLRPYFVKANREKAEVHMTVSCKDAEYGTKPAPQVVTDKVNPSYTIEYQKDGETEWSDKAPVLPGTYHIKVTEEESEGCKKAVAECTFKIVPKKVQVNAVILTKTEDGKKDAQFVKEPELTGILDGDKVSLTYGKPEFTSEKPGTAIPVTMTEPFALKGKDADLYELVQPELKGTILAKGNGNENGSGNGNASGGSSGNDIVSGPSKTADTSHPGVWLALLCASSAAGIIIMKKRG